MTSPQQIPVALEIGKKRIFASALDWPGWARAGRDEEAALDALLAYGPRYQRVMRSKELDFLAPTDASAFVVAERLAGDSTTDFGAPSIAPLEDAAPLEAAELRRLLRILDACWRALAEIVSTASVKPLRKGPRGGGRDVSQIRDHVVESHYSYLQRIYWREPHETVDDMATLLSAVKDADERALAFAISDAMPAAGPRGGALWKPRYFVRRAAWHILDHVWEIEDRLD